MTANSSERPTVKVRLAESKDEIQGQGTFWIGFQIPSDKSMIFTAVPIDIGPSEKTPTSSEEPSEQV
jgi:hypothetical protein